MADVQYLENLGRGTWSSLGCCQEAFAVALDRCTESRLVQRIWGRDGSLWKVDEVSIAAIEDRLGWLDLPSQMQLDIERLLAMGMELRSEGIERVILLGMEKDKENENTVIRYCVK